jgi:hypothetical protein
MATVVAVAQVDVEWDDRFVESNLKAVDTAITLYPHVDYVFRHGC